MGSEAPVAFGKLMQRLHRQIDLPEDVFESFSRIAVDRSTLAPGNVLYHEDGPMERVHVLETGWMIASSALPDGSRYIHRIYQEGDLVGVEDINWAYATSTVEALTACRVASYSKRDHIRLFDGSGSLGAALHGMAMNDQVVVNDTARANACLKAPGQIGHLLLTIEARQRLTSDAPEADSFAFPLRQHQIADAVGLSLVHTNKAIAKLKEQKIAHVGGGRVTISDRDALVGLTGFANRYLVDRTQWSQALAS